MKKITMMIFTVLLTVLFLASCGENKSGQQETEGVTAMDNNPHQEMTGHLKMSHDNRISLDLSPKMAHHQLMNMRSHVKAVTSIIHFLSKDEFDSASEVAHSQLGLTKEMEKMCSAFSNPDFVKLGMAFHKSADAMADVFKTKDKNKSLQALSTTMNYCVDCHSTFRQ